MWRGVNNHRRTFAQNFNQQFDIDGKIIKFGKRAEATAEYLENKQWGNQNDTPPKGTPPRAHNLKVDIDWLRYEKRARPYLKGTQER